MYIRRAVINSRRPSHPSNEACELLGMIYTWLCLKFYFIMYIMIAIMPQILSEQQ